MRAVRWVLAVAVVVGCRNAGPESEEHVAGHPSAASSIVASRDDAGVHDMTDWESVKVLPQPPRALDIAGTTWRVVDEIEMLNADSERKHGFAIQGAKDTYRERSMQRYPDDTKVDDTGHGLLEGVIEFDLLNLDAGRPVVVLHRLDYIVGNYQLEVSVNGTKVGQVACVGADRVRRWRNWPIPIAAEYVTGRATRVRLKSLTPGRDIHIFHVWIYQAQ